MAPMQLGIHCLAWKSAVTRTSLRPCGQAMRYPKLVLIAEHTCLKMSWIVEFPNATLSATRGMETPCISLKSVTTTIFSTPIGCL